VEDSLLLLITQNLLKRDTNFVTSIAQESISQKLYLIWKNKKMLSKHVEYIFFLV